MYFLRRLRPLEVAGDRVRSLRISLNAPVLSAADLPVGPARAVIVVHRDPRGRMDATVGVRSLRGGEVAYWSFDGELESEADLDVAADAALTFSESLGFLFDESGVGAGEEAAKIFQAWLAGEQASGGTPARSGRAAGVARAAAAAAGSARRGEMPELELDDLIAAEPAPPRTTAAPSPTPGPAAQPALPEPAPEARSRPAPKTLSKFRGREATPSAAPARKTPLRQPLARVQLVKRRSPEEERKLLIRKLVTSF